MRGDDVEDGFAESWRIRSLSRGGSPNAAAVLSQCWEGLCPAVDELFHPGRHWHGADAAVLAAQVGNYQRRSRFCMCSIVRAAASARRSQQPDEHPRMALSHLPLSVTASGRLTSCAAWSRVSRFPALVPLWRAPGPSRIEAA